MPLGSEPHRLGETPGTVTVWRIPLAQPADVVAACRSVLTADERQKADRYRCEAPCRRFTLTRAVLRQQVATLLDQDPRAVTLAYGPHGKPYLPDAPWLHVNVSHSHDEALCAITTQGPVGVDIEYMRPLKHASAIARTKFAPEEFAIWEALPPELQAGAFFACWSRKEAFIKATGEGLSRPLDDFIVTLRPGEPGRLIAIRSQPTAVADWTLLELPAPAGYAAALMVQGPMPSLVCDEWVPEPLRGRMA
jgi:4'-phosphopantetheinyl transferase